MEPPKAVRIPKWIDVLCGQLMKEVGAKNFSDYVRGLILKHARTLDVAIPPESEQDWPEWIKKPQKPIRQLPKNEIEPF